MEWVLAEEQENCTCDLGTLCYRPLNYTKPRICVNSAINDITDFLLKGCSAPSSNNNTNTIFIFILFIIQAKNFFYFLFIWWCLRWWFWCLSSPDTRSSSIRTRRNHHSLVVALREARLWSVVPDSATSFTVILSAKFRVHRNKMYKFPRRWVDSANPLSYGYPSSVDRRGTPPCPSAPIQTTSYGNYPLSPSNHLHPSTHPTPYHLWSQPSDAGRDWHFEGEWNLKKLRN